MGSSGSGRVRQRSKSYDSWFNESFSYKDGALSKAIKRSDARSTIWPGIGPLLPEGPENVISLTKHIQHIEKGKEDVRKECDNLQSQPADIESKLMLREVLKNFKKGRNGIDKRLMNQAWKGFPKEFPANSRVLLEYLKWSFGAKWHCTQKFWDLLTLAYKEFREVSWEYVGKLMDLVNENLPKEFSSANFKQLIQTEVLPNSNLCAKFQMLKGKVSDKKLYNLMNLGCHVFHSKFPHEKFEDLMKKVHQLFPEEFPQEFFADTYTAMVAILVNRDASLEGKKLLDINNRKLDCLREVATKFQWSCENCRWTAENFGEQFFLLCKDVALSNRDIFHPELKGLRRLAFDKKAREGFFKIDGVNVGPVTMELAHI